MVIRPAVKTDIPAILALYRELEDAYPVETGTADEEVNHDVLWRNVAADSRQQILVGEQNGRIVGTVTVIIVPNLGHRGSPWAAVENVVVARDCRGRGAGTALMTAAGEIARRHGCYKIVLSSNLSRREAHDFYHRLGWRQTHAGFSLML
ncbi:hypothetical protein A6M21_06035 [Desulfotomaculum copahuensis]|uniref:N-acetyltransferase domain-containing protein n=1 Tax=Desulfotomaculum copahuensis TaxID=1838280 RepID=A0A1B7LH75_9FIRM|nr:hypothetical protein A6M21_06035 [Desulfotomaculum copahuensis]